MVRIDPQVAAPGQLGLVLRALDRLVAKLVGALELRLELLLYGEGQLQRHRRERLDGQRTDGTVNLCARQAWHSGSARSMASF